MGLNHSRQDFTHLNTLFAVGLVRPRQPIRNSENRTQIITWMTPFRSKPTIIIIQPTNHRTNIECPPNRIKLVIRPGDFGSVRNGRT